MRTIDRYVIRQVLWPAFLGLLIFTFLLIIPLILKIAEDLIAKGVPTVVILRLMGTLLPQALGLSIPMSLLLGLLIGFGKLSSDREFVAMQACGIGLLRLLRPVALLSGLAFVATLYIFHAALGAANQASRDITFSILADRAEGEVKPRVFFDRFPDIVLYVRDIHVGGGGWDKVFMAVNRPDQPQTIYLAESGRIVIDRLRRKVEMVLENGSSHVVCRVGLDPDCTAEEYKVIHFDRQLLSVNPDRIFPSVGPGKGMREMSIAELRAVIADQEKRGTLASEADENGRRQTIQGAWIEIHKKFSIPFACIVLGLIGLALGATNRRDGRLASFVIGIAVIFVYYALLESASNIAKGQYIPTWLAVWSPNIVFLVLGVWLFVRRLRATDRPPRLLAWVSTLRVPHFARRVAARAGRATTVVRLPMAGLLDRYVMMLYLRVFALSMTALLSLFYLSTFIDLSDEVLRGDATWTSLAQHLRYMTPEDVYYVLPMSVLLATLVTIGLLTRNSELIVMKACGISLYRVAVPLVIFGLMVTVTIVGIQETVLGPARKQANVVRRIITGQPIETLDVFSRKWMAATNGDIYNYIYFDARQQRITGLTVYQFDHDMARLSRRTYVEQAAYAAGERVWYLDKGWTREFKDAAMTLRPFDKDRLALEPATYFAAEVPDPDFMNYAELRGYITSLSTRGLDVTEHRVALERKISFPFVTLIMTLIAVPFAVTTGARGAMYGIGVGIVMAFSYWSAMSVFGALGAAGVLTPALAAWAPNMLFGAAALYLVLTAKT